MLDTALRPVFSEINALMRMKHVRVKDRDVELEFYLGGDYKVHIDFHELALTYY